MDHIKNYRLYFYHSSEDKEKQGKWIVIDTVIQPSSGISFSAVWCKIKLIIWYQSDVFLPPGSLFTPIHSGVILDDKKIPVTIYNVTSFNNKLWSLIKKSNGCPTNTVQLENKCPNKRCILEICPYGLLKEWALYIHFRMNPHSAVNCLNKSNYWSGEYFIV